MTSQQKREQLKRRTVEAIRLDRMTTKQRRIEQERRVQMILAPEIAKAKARLEVAHV